MTNRGKTTAALAGLLSLAMALFSMVTPLSAADTFPEKEITFIVPWPPGGGADIMARLIGAAIAEKLETNVVVDNRPGAAGIVGTQLATKAPPDGHTLLLGSTGPNTIAKALYKNLPYDPIEDLTPITQITSLPLLLSVNADLPVKTVQELIAYAKEHPGELNYGSVGEGTAQHLAAEIFKVQAGLDMVHIPYKGAAPTFTALAAGEISLTFDNIMASQAMIDSGRIRPIGISSLERSPAMPDVPTISETGLPDFNVVAFQNISVPKGTPQEVVDKLHAVITEYLQTDEMKERAKQSGAILVGNTPAEEDQRLRTAVEQWTAAAKAAGISLEY